MAAKIGPMALMNVYTATKVCMSSETGGVVIYMCVIIIGVYQVFLYCSSLWIQI